MGTAAISSGGTQTTPAFTSPTTEDDDAVHRDSPSTAIDTAATQNEDRPTTAQDDVVSPISAASPTSPTKTGSNRLSGLFSKLKRRSKHNSSAPESGFIGGATLRNSESNPQSRRGSSHNSPVPGHIPQLNAGGNHSDVSSLSSDSDAGRGRALERTATSESKASKQSEYEEARDTFNENLAPPPSFGTELNTRNSGSPVRDSKFHEVL